jgi:hypothetical protein
VGQVRLNQDGSGQDVVGVKKGWVKIGRVKTWIGSRRGSSQDGSGQDVGRVKMVWVKP